MRKHAEIIGIIILEIYHGARNQVAKAAMMHIRARRALLRRRLFDNAGYNAAATAYSLQSVEGRRPKTAARALVARQISSVSRFLPSASRRLSHARFYLDSVISPPPPLPRNGRSPLN